MFNVDSIVRQNIKKLQAYSSARSEFKGEASVYLDANENSFGSPLLQKYNRYPDPLQHSLKEKISEIKGVPPQNIFVGNGSDEAIDLLLRIFCEPKHDNILICPPTYGMYQVSAEINDVACLKVTLLPSFDLDVERILETVTETTKLLFICSPNNPTGNSFNQEDVELLIQKFNGIVVIDEAYINYSKQKSAIRFLTEYENVVVLQTFSKAWGLAGLRLGMAFAPQVIIDYLNKVKPPYNINQNSQQLAMDAIENIDWVNAHIHQTVAERNLMYEELKQLTCIEKVFATDANFILIQVKNADTMYAALAQKGIIVRNRSSVELCNNCLRITVGTTQENRLLLKTLKEIA